MAPIRARRYQLIAVLTALLAALFVRSWLQGALTDRGFNELLAFHLSYLLVPALLALLLSPLLLQRRVFLATVLRPRHLSMGLVGQAIAIGLLLRLVFWCYLIAGIALGWINAETSSNAVGPTFTFQCLRPAIMALSVLVMVVLVPLVEELLHRALVIDALKEIGALPAIMLSALIFTVFHSPGTWALVMLSGLVFATQYWRTRSLWSSLISHATFNATIQFDWYCLRGQWNPATNELPLWLPGVIAGACGLAAVAAIAGLLNGKTLDGKPPAEGP